MGVSALLLNKSTSNYGYLVIYSLVSSLMHYVSIAIFLDDHF